MSLTLSLRLSDKEQTKKAEHTRRLRSLKFASLWRSFVTSFFTTSYENRVGCKHFWGFAAEASQPEARGVNKHFLQNLFQGARLQPHCVSQLPPEHDV